MTRILVVDDEPTMLRGLRVNLEARGYDVDLAADGAEALAAASARLPDVVILDLGLPDMDGVDVIEGLRAWSSMPIVVLSAREQEPDKIAALDAGADDYVTKPFGMGELLARIRAAERRTAPPGQPPLVLTSAFRTDMETKRIEKDGTKVHLTPTEWHLVEILVRNPGKLVGQRQLLQEVWGPRYGSETNYLRVYMAQIRRKLEPDPARPRFFLTEPGMGYRFEPGEVTTAEPAGGVGGTDPPPGRIA
jgi:two-component system, OmpR family, KDP operon response regulator KdpE